MPSKSVSPEAIENQIDDRQSRRSIYQLTDKSTLSDQQLQTLVQDAVKYAPTSFNMQQSRAVLVTGDMHHKVWDTVFECYTKSFADDSESLTSSLRAVHLTIIPTSCEGPTRRASPYVGHMS